jgi:transporter family-2 protein
MFLAFLAGIALATQASLNSQLGQILSSSLLATFVAFTSSSLIMSFVLLSYVKKLPSLEVIKSVPIYLWFTGGLLSAFALALFYYLIPKIGILPLVSLSLAGQLLFAVIVGHFGFFNFPVTTIDPSKIIGVASMLLAIFLINKG